jgi:DNA helicase-2/ATP-dependent DNA helicase PcrA
VLVRSLPEILRTLAGIERGTNLTPEKDRRLDTDQRLGRLVGQVASGIRAGTIPAPGTSTSSPTSFARAIVDELVGDTDVHRRFVSESATYSELSEWLRGLRSFDHARTSGHALPFLACVGIAAGRVRPDGRFPHIIVDEAQDVRPLEWRVLTALLETGGSWTLVGDMNQRRSDWSPVSWSQLVEDEEMIPDIAELEVAVLETGYRSTRQILRFANQLLPRTERTVHAIVDGPEPVVRRVRADQLVAGAVAEAVGLAGVHPAGTVAVITLQPRSVADALRGSGRSRGSLRFSWKSEGSAPIVPLHPTQARGLEFDAVVVVEPSEFPPNLGRHGLLYTSLTRATKQLVVLHSGGLPAGMRSPRS